MAENTDKPESSAVQDHAVQAPPPPRKKYKKQIIWGIAALVLLVLVTVYYFIFVAPYESTDDAFIDGYTTLISPRVSGPVVNLLITDNQEVKQGDVLVEIDPRDYVASLALASADLEAAKSQVASAEAQVQVSQSRVVQAQAAVASADAENARAAADLKRYQTVESQAISKTAYDQAQAEALSTEANLESARSQVKSAQADVVLSQAAVGTAKAAVGQAQARLDQAKLNLSYTKITAPFDGRITARTVQMGNYIAPGQALFALVPRYVWVTANFKETQLTYMRPGQPVTVHIDAYPSHSFRAKVDSLQAGTGARFSLLPPENAVGNFVKIVQRVPVKIVFDEELPAELDITPGLSVEPRVRVK